MKKLFLIIFLIVLSFTGLTSSTGNCIQTRKIYNIVEIHSNSYDHICTSPQKYGFEQELREFSFNQNIFFNVTSFYINAKTINIKPEQINLVANIIISEINKIKPDFIVTTDDVAFEYVGIPLSKTTKVIFSGLNRPYKEYQALYPVNIKNVSGVEERYDLDKIFLLIKKARFSINKIYLLVEGGDFTLRSETDYYMEQNYLDEIGKKYPVEIISVDGINHLRTVLMNLNKQPRGIIIPVLQRLMEEDHPGTYVDKKTIVSEIVKLNKVHLELCGNFSFSKLHISVCVSPSFEEMGRTQANIIEQSILTNTFNQNIIVLPNYIWVNQKRLKELNLEGILTINFQEIDKVNTD